MAHTPTRPRPHRTEIHSLSEIPDFATEAEEAAFWSTHTLGDELLAGFEPPPPGLLPPPRKRAVRAKRVLLSDWKVVRDWLKVKRRSAIHARLHSAGALRFAKVGRLKSPTSPKGKTPTSSGKRTPRA